MSNGPNLAPFDPTWPAAFSYVEARIQLNGVGDPVQVLCNEYQGFLIDHNGDEIKCRYLGHRPMTTAQRNDFMLAQERSA